MTKSDEIKDLILKAITGFSNVSLVVEEPKHSSFRRRYLDYIIRIDDFMYIERYNFQQDIPVENIAYGAVRGAFLDYFEGKMFNGK